MLTSDERIELRIEVNLLGRPISEVARKYGVSGERAEELCNFQKPEVANPMAGRYKQSKGLLEQWPELDFWLNQNDLNIRSLCSMTGIKTNTLVSAIHRKRLLQPDRWELLEQICQVTGLENPIKKPPTDVQDR